MSIEIRLHLKDHCIETEAKHEFKRIMDSYFNADEESHDLEDRIELLREFLEESDFAQLRSSDPRLSGDTEADVILYRDDDKSIRISFP